MKITDPRLIVPRLRSITQPPPRGFCLPDVDDAAEYIETTLPLWDAYVKAAPRCKNGCVRGFVGRITEVPGLTNPVPCWACPDHPGLQSFAEWCDGLITALNDLSVVDQLRRGVR